MKPSKELTKLLLSTTSRFVGEYEDEGCLITHASQGKIRRPEWKGTTENPFSRNFIAVSIKTPEWKRDSIVIPDFTYLGEWICISLSILFGKRFDNHGLLEQHGDFYVPWINNIPPSCNHTLAYNDHSPRIDFDIPLNLSEFKRIAPLLYESNISRDALLSAGRFYLQAIQEYEKQPEIAFLSLISCGEILSNFCDIPLEKLLDEQSQKDIQNIRENLPNGESIANRIKDKLYQVKAKYTYVLKALLDDEFFSKTQSPDKISALKKDEIEKRIKASYDLRSQYVHSGKDFINWLSYSNLSKEEIHVRKPVLNNAEIETVTDTEKKKKLKENVKKLKATLEWCPTFAGMERIMRYCLLRFWNENGKVD